MLLLFLQTGFSLVMEMKEHDRDIFGKLVVQLYQHKLINSSNLINLFQHLFETVEEIIIDVPQGINHICKLLGKLVGGDIIDLLFLKESLSPHVVESGRAESILRELLKSICKESNAEKVKAVMEDNDIQLKDFIFAFDKEKKSKFSESVNFLV